MGIQTQELPLAETITDVIGHRLLAADAYETVRISLARLAANVWATRGPSFETRADLFADLDWPAGAEGRVYGDANAAFIGVYLKAGAIGAGSWSLIGPLPESDLTPVYALLDALGTLSTQDADAVTVTGGSIDAVSLTVTAAGSIAALDSISRASVSVASASTIDLDAMTGFAADLTGSTTITAVTLASGRGRLLRATGTPLITVGASLGLNGNSLDVTLAVGDWVYFRGYSGGVVRGFVLRHSGKTVVPVATADITGITAFARTFLDDADANAVLTTLGINTFPDLIDDIAAIQSSDTAQNVRLDDLEDADTSFNSTLQGIVDYLTNTFGRGIAPFTGTVWSIIDLAGKGALVVYQTGQVLIANLKSVTAETRDILFSTTDLDYGGTDINTGCIDNSGRMSWGVTDRGRLRFAPDEWDPEEVIALLAASGLSPTGQISEVRKPYRRLYTYWSTQEGGVNFPFRCRFDVSGGAHIRDGDPFIDVHIDNGQSWITDGIPVVGFDSAVEPYSVLTMRDENGAIPAIGTNDAATGIYDLIAAPTVNIQLGRYSCVAYQELCRDISAHARPIITYCHGYPGTPWDGTVFDGLEPGSSPWANGLLMHAAAADAIALYGKKPKYRCVTFIHAASGDGSGIDYYGVLEEMVAAYDVLDLNPATGEELQFFIGQRPANANHTKATEACVTGQLQFCKDNTNGRSFMVGPWYQHPMRDDIHLTSSGYARLAEEIGLAKRKVLVEGEDWVPLYVTNAALAGSVITLTTSSPFGGPLVVNTTLIEAAVQHGFVVLRDTVAEAVTVALDNSNLAAPKITLTLGSAPVSAEVFEWSYAYRGPGAPVGGGEGSPSHSGAWGNIKMVGPPSHRFDGETIDTWLCIDFGEITVP